ncbi:sn-Glycerol-3-phosphate transporter permease [Salmonella enterica subsp. enterica]|nr:sn-Glycerol-3-phosphate transporter permease [Salmonella enterica subsp. enterica]
MFPLYVAFVAATLDDRAVFETPMTLLPGTQLLENIKTIWVNGVGVNSAPFWLMMLNSFIYGVQHYGRQNHGIYAFRIRHRLVSFSPA